MSEQHGGWYETTLDDFRRECISINDKFKQTDQWWRVLEWRLNHYANQMSSEYMAEPRFAGMPEAEVEESLDLIVILLLDISRSYANLLLRRIEPKRMIYLLNNSTITLQNTLNSDFVEFIQILLTFVKSSEKFGEANTLTLEHLADDPTFSDFTSEESIKRNSENINNTNNARGFYGLYKVRVLDSVKLLEVFLLKAYTGQYEELEARDIVCQDYFVQTVEYSDKIIEWVKDFEKHEKEYDKLTKKHRKLNKLIHFAAKGGESDPAILEEYVRQLNDLPLASDYQAIEDELFEKIGFNSEDFDNYMIKSEIKEKWKEMYNSINVINTDNLNQSDRVNWKETLKGWKKTFELLLYSTLLARSRYDFFKHPDLKTYKKEFEKDIYKAYEQFQVKLALFYKRLLTKFLGGFESYGEYIEANTDTHKNKKIINPQFIDIIKCIETELEMITDFIQKPRNHSLESDDSDDDDDDDESEMSLFPSTRHTHLYDESLQIDEDEDSDDEFERIGSEYIQHVGIDPVDTRYRKYAKKIQALEELLKENNRKNIPKIFLENLGKRCSCLVEMEDGSKVQAPDSIILDVSEPIPQHYVYHIELGGKWERNRFSPPSAASMVTLSVNDVTDIRDNTEFKIGDTVYYVYVSSDSESGYIYPSLLSGKVVGIPVIPDSESVIIEGSNSDTEERLKKDVINLTKLGAIMKYINDTLEREKLYHDKLDELDKTFQHFLYANRIAEATSHYYFSRTRRGNPNLDRELVSRGLNGLDYVRQTTRKMIQDEDKTIDQDELRRLRGDNPPKTSIFPERINYLETIMEDDKEFETPKRPIKPWQREPLVWDSDDEMEEDFDGQRRLDRYLESRRRGISRPLQRQWYKQHGVQDIIGRDTSDQVLGEIPSDLVENNQIFREDQNRQLLNEQLRSRYNMISRSNLPARRNNLSQQLSDLYEQRRSTARERAEHMDREIEQRALAAERRREREFRDEVERLSGIQRDTLNLHDHLRSRDFATTDNIRRRIDTMRRERETLWRENRNREDAALLVQNIRRRNLTRRRRQR